MNKKKPELKCNGKCFLSKKIKEAEEKNDAESGLTVKWEETAPCTIDVPYFELKTIAASAVMNANPSPEYHFIFARKLLHPPSLS